MDSKLLEIIATLVVAVGGTIGGALLALRKALKQPDSTSNGGLVPKLILTATTEQLHDVERRLMEELAKVRTDHAVLAERVDNLTERVDAAERQRRR